MHTSSTEPNTSGGRPSQVPVETRVIDASRLVVFGSLRGELVISEDILQKAAQAIIDDSHTREPVSSKDREVARSYARAAITAALPDLVATMTPGGS